MYTHIYMYVCMYACMYIYIYIYIYIGRPRVHENLGYEDTTVADLVASTAHRWICLAVSREGMNMYFFSSHAIAWCPGALQLHR